MKKITLLLIIGISGIAVNFYIAGAKAWDYDDPYYEEIGFSVDCDRAGAVASFEVYSKNYSLIHFPSGVNMFDPHLENCTGIYLDIYPYEAPARSLRYVFIDITPEEARENADAVTPSISAAFGLSFTWKETMEIGIVDYTASPPSNMIDYAAWLVSACFAEDVNGFSNGLPGLIALTPQDAVITIVCWREYGDWVTLIGSRPIISIPAGSDSHTIDVLDLLGVSSLGPSPYSYDTAEATFRSTIGLTITSSDSVSFVSCEPPLAPTPDEKGWTYTQPSSGRIRADFSFGSDPSPVTSLSFTFSGTVVPEFTSLTLILTLMVAATSILALKKRLPQKN